MPTVSTVFWTLFLVGISYSPWIRIRRIWLWGLCYIGSVFITYSMVRVVLDIWVNYFSGLTGSLLAWSGGIQFMVAYATVLALFLILQTVVTPIYWNRSRMVAIHSHGR